MNRVLFIASPVIVYMLSFGDTTSSPNPSESWIDISLMDDYTESPIYLESERTNPLSDTVGTADLAISRYDSLIKKYSDQHGFDWLLIAALIWEESRFDPKAISRSRAKGLMQIMPQTAQELKLVKIYDPESNICAGVKYFKRQCELFRQEEGIELVRFALASYHSGFGRVVDAQKIARHIGLPTDSWESLRKTLPMLDRKQSQLHRRIWAKPRPRHGFYRGARRTIAYVELVEKKYMEYQKLAGLDVQDRELAAIYQRSKEDLY